MSKPWDNELTTKTDLAQAEMSEFIIPAVHVDFARELERRLRHAEKLLELSVKTHGLGFVTGKMTKHLEAAKAEDNP